MLKSVMSCLFKYWRKHTHKQISGKELEEYMRVEGVSYADIFPPNISYSANRNRKRR